MIPYFERLGDAVCATWDGDAASLPAIAVAALRERPAPEHTSLHEVLDHVASADEARFAPQADLEATFGEPPVTVFRGRRFRIDVNLWASSTTAIHQHGFAGAFQVLHGSSLHTRYRFTPRRRVHAHLVLGDLDLERIDVLEAGEVVAIEPGPAFIHGLFHLDHPSATVVVRTDGEQEWLPQRTYDPPGVAWESTLQRTVLSPLERRQAQVVRFLGRADLDDAPVIEQILAGADPLFAYHLLSEVLPERWRREARPLIDVEEALDRWFSVVPADEAIRDALRDAAIGKVRRLDAAARRAWLTRPDDRLVMGALLVAPDRAAVETLLADRYPDEPPRRVLLRFIARGLRERDPTDRSLCALGLHEDAVDLLQRLVAEDLDFDGLLASLTAEHGAESVEASAGHLAERVREIRRLSLFAPWFA